MVPHPQPPFFPPVDGVEVHFSSSPLIHPLEGLPSFNGSCPKDFFSLFLTYRILFQPPPASDFYFSPLLLPHLKPTLVQIKIVRFCIYLLLINQCCLSDTSPLTSIIDGKVGGFSPPYLARFCSPD